jgi:hypothetical protein
MFILPQGFRRSLSFCLHLPVSPLFIFSMFLFINSLIIILIVIFDPTDKELLADAYLKKMPVRKIGDKITTARNLKLLTVFKVTVIQAQ